MGKTFAEKILGRKAGHSVRAGECVIVNVDVMMASDTTGPLAIQAFREMGGERLAKPDRTILILDHAVPCPNEGIAELHAMIRTFAKEQNCRFYDQHWGVCHQVLLENHLVGEGDLVLGGDSHTCTYGVAGAFSTGAGSTDLGAAMLTGQTWLRVPETTRIELTGVLPEGVTAKDVILRIIGDLSSDGATYEAIEYGGDGFARFSIEEAITVCNMTIEMGGKSGVFVSALRDLGLRPDADAGYKRVLQYRAADFEPVISCPHAVDHVRTVAEMAGKPIDLVYLGSCTNGRISDLAAAAGILKGKKLAGHTRMIVCPASSRVMQEAVRLGYIETFLQAGAIINPPGCSLCVGTLGGVPSGGESVVSTTNRNFKGRMGNSKAFIYLASPLTAAVTAVTGVITDPRGGSYG